MQYNLKTFFIEQSIMLPIQIYKML